MDRKRERTGGKKALWKREVVHERTCTEGVEEGCKENMLSACKASWRWRREGEQLLRLAR